MIVDPVRDALDYYKRLNDAAKDEHRMHRKSIVTSDFTAAIQTPVDNSSVSVPNSPTKPSPSHDIVKSSSGTNVRKPSISFSQMVSLSYLQLSEKAYFLSFCVRYNGLLDN